MADQHTHAPTLKQNADGLPMWAVAVCAVGVMVVSLCALAGVVVVANRSAGSNGRTSLVGQEFGDGSDTEVLIGDVTKA